MGVLCCGGMAANKGTNQEEDINRCSRKKENRSRKILRINEEIDKELRQDKRKLENTIKILLLGCGEAGKVDRK